MQWPDHVCDAEPGTPWSGRLMLYLYNHWPWFRRRFQRNLSAMIQRHTK